MSPHPHPENLRGHPNPIHALPNTHSCTEHAQGSANHLPWIPTRVGWAESQWASYLDRITRTWDESLCLRQGLMWSRLAWNSLLSRG